MDRRTFVVTGAAGAGGLLLGSGRARATEPVAGPETRTLEPGGEPFALDYAPHFGLFARTAGNDPIDQLRFMADQGFRSLEDNGMRERPVAEQERIAGEMARLGMRMGVFVAHAIPWTEPQLTGGAEDGREAFLADIRTSVEVAKRVNATWMTVVPGHVDLRLDAGYQTANVVASLRRAADILAPHGLVMVLEPLNPRDHPGLFLTKIAQAYEICRAVASPSCKILDDLYHQQITEGNLIPNIDAAWDEIAYFQIGDNPGRNEPDTGEIHYANVFRHIRNRGYDGILGMEHGVAGEGVEGERAVVEAYRRVDPSG